MNRRQFIAGSAALAASTSLPAAPKPPFLVQHQNMVLTRLFGEKTTLGLLAPVGRPAIIHFWASWCAPCAEEMRFLASLSEKSKPSSLSVLGIHHNSATEAVEKVRAYLEKNNGLKYAHVTGDKARYNIFNESGVFGRMVTTLPKLFVFDRTGRKIATHSGFDAAEMNKLEKRVLEL